MNNWNGSLHKVIIVINVMKKSSVQIAEVIKLKIKVMKYIYVENVTINLNI